MNPRKNRMLLTAAAALLTIFFIFYTSSSPHTKEIVIPNASKFEGDSGVQIPGGSKTKASVPSLDLAKDVAEVKQDKGDAKLATKKVANSNNLVKTKQGLIDEAKVREAELDNDTKKIPLIAGDPSSKKAHDKLTNEETNSKGKQIQTQEVKLANGKDVDDEDDLLTGSSNGITADKGLGTVEQKEIHDKEIDEKKTSGKSTAGVAKDSTPQNLAMKAQENAEKNGVSKDKGTSFNAKQEYNKILSKSPVVIFSKSYCPFSKKLKHLLKTEYHISPEPIIIELDTHENGEELQQHIGEQTGRFTVPNFIIDGKSRGGADDIVQLHENNEFIDIFHSWSTGGAKIKKLTP